MVKGVNRQIIEVNNTDSIYFEKAVFYLRPGVRRLPEDISGKEIDRIFKPMGVNAKKSRRLKIGSLMIVLAILGTVAALIAVII